jgi:hypothetical protein
MPIGSPDYRTALDRLARRLEAETPFAVRRVPASEESPLDTLLLAPPSDPPDGEPAPAEGGGETGPRLEISFAPGMEEQLGEASILQCFIPIAAVQPEAEIDLLRLLNRVNAASPLPASFFFWEQRRMACLRATVMLPADAGGAEALAVEAVWMCDYLMETFGAAVAEVAIGAKSLADAVGDHPFAALLGG